MTTQPLTVDHCLEFEYSIAGADSAQGLRLEERDEFPEVLATSRMIALMELAAARLMRCLLPAGQLSVGVGVDVTHLAATPIFETVRARAIYLGPDGRLHRFRVEIHDAGGCVGAGIHTRAIIRPEDLLARARRRISAMVQTGSSAC
jgi:predicted thioesterase